MECLKNISNSREIQCGGCTELHENGVIDENIFFIISMKVLIIIYEPVQFMYSKKAITPLFRAKNPPKPTQS